MAKKTEKVEKEVAEEFNLEAYEKVVFLTLDKLKRKNEKLTDAEEKELEAAEKIAFNNPGKKAMKTETYVVSMRTVRLVKGLPTPDEVIGLFSAEGQKHLFS